MSEILDYILQIFTFQLDPMASIAFYLALIVIPGMVYLLGKQNAEKGQKIISLTFKIVTAVIFITGFALIYLIASSGTKYEVFETKEGGKVEKMQVNGEDVVGIYAVQSDEKIIVEGDVLLKSTELTPEGVEQLKESDPNAIIRKDENGNDQAYEAMEEEVLPQPKDIIKVELKGGDMVMVQDGKYYNEGVIESSVGFSILIVLICFGLMLGFGISKLIEQPKQAIKPLIMFGALVLIIALSYGMESSFFTNVSDNPDFMEAFGGEVSPRDEKDSGGSIIAAIILISIASTLAVGWSIYNLISKR